LKKKADNLPPIGRGIYFVAFLVSFYCLKTTTRTKQQQQFNNQRKQHHLLTLVWFEFALTCCIKRLKFMMGRNDSLFVIKCLGKFLLLFDSTVF